ALVPDIRHAKSAHSYRSVAGRRRDAALCFRISLGWSVARTGFWGLGWSRWQAGTLEGANDETWKERARSRLLCRNVVVDSVGISFSRRRPGSLRLCAVNRLY